MAPRNFSFSALSLEKALAVRMPEILDSMSALMPAVVCLTFLEVRDMARRFRVTIAREMGIMMSNTRASRHCTVKSTAMAPITVTPEIKISSGPWWASSVISNSSAVMRLMRWPVRFLS